MPHREIWKFGGTSVDDAEKRHAIGEKIAQANHMDVVVVVSAAAGVTDALHREIGSLGQVPQHLIDSYVATGEMMSAPLVAAAIHAAGRPTAVVPATQLFSCDNRFSDGTVRAVETAPILRLLRQKVVPVVGGFFGLSADGRLITLGAAAATTPRSCSPLHSAATCACSRPAATASTTPTPTGLRLPAATNP